MTGHVLITGTGRSGTGYIARVLQLAGVQIAHEGVYGPLQALGADPRLRWFDLDGDASWLALPIAHRHIGPVFLAVREPLAVIGSMLRRGLFADDGRQHGHYRAVIETFAAEAMAQPTEQERAAMFWAHWNLQALERCDGWWRITEPLAAVYDVAASLGRTLDPSAVARAVVQTPPTYNGTTDSVPLPLAALPDGPARDAMLDMANRFGYSVT